MPQKRYFKDKVTGSVIVIWCDSHENIMKARRLANDKNYVEIDYQEAKVIWEEEERLANTSI